MGIPLCVICSFSLAAFQICSLCLMFVNLINMCLGGVSPWVYPVWDSLDFFDLSDYFLPVLGKFSTIISSNIFSWSFFLSSSSGTPMI